MVTVKAFKQTVVLLGGSDLPGGVRAALEDIAEIITEDEYRKRYCSKEQSESIAVSYGKLKK